MNITFCRVKVEVKVKVKVEVVEMVVVQVEVMGAEVWRWCFHCKRRSCCFVCIMTHAPLSHKSAMSLNCGAVGAGNGSTNGNVGSTTVRNRLSIMSRNRTLCFSFCAFNDGLTLHSTACAHNTPGVEYT